ncbi:hypothetical protein HNP86_001996 [Methanococcus maripaludis]|uniref:Uncharacterized protein n=1 Tax=Methanococcus maripaludis TaxID=39152 RepID=A0A7J9NX05_METMI|nr:hypothetical protein [Methanococcus maripaludis]MBA2851837.1 hypothetical protein [Methanococcus maripaludis]
MEKLSELNGSVWAELRVKAKFNELNSEFNLLVRSKSTREDVLFDAAVKQLAKLHWHSAFQNHDISVVEVNVGSARECLTFR